eukprot:TRINITY_DN9041_c0_g1_i1.p1 TRINITY_DN9041_c0_g1~~TRINITY_DN9041_c0_g1_i1.p1  ORF type:complete len:411 (+),score=131.40 TRINITY_DN9041_c0_g1_i1:193-1425(+)
MGACLRTQACCWKSSEAAQTADEGCSGDHPDGQLSPPSTAAPASAVPVPERSLWNLLLYVLIEPGDERVPVELPVDATVGDLKAAVYEAHGPPPPEQVLTVGTEELVEACETPLSDTHLVSNEVVVGVRRRQRLHHKSVSCGNEHGLALLETGEVVGWGSPPCFDPLPDFPGRVVSVHAGRHVSAAVAAGRLVVWGVDADGYAEDVQRLRDREREVVCCSAAVYAELIGVVDSEGCVVLCGSDKGRFDVSCLPAGVAAVSVSCEHVVVLTREGNASVLAGQTVTEFDLGGKPAVSVSAGVRHFVVLLADGSVRCFGDNDCGQCNVPAQLSEAQSCAAGCYVTAVCCRDGAVVCWGEPLAAASSDTGPCVAVDIGRRFMATVTADGRVVCHGESFVSMLTPDFSAHCIAVA